MSEIINTENLVELHEQLDDFAKHHRTKAGVEVLQIINEYEEERKEIAENPKDRTDEIAAKVWRNTLTDLRDLIKKAF